MSGIFKSVAGIFAELATAAGAGMIGFIQSAFGAAIRTLADELRDETKVTQFAGADATGDSDSSVAINNALSSGAKLISGCGKTFRIDSPVSVPEGVTLRDIKLIAGTPGMNMALIANKSWIKRVKFTGTGTVSIVERAVYPSVDGVTGAYLDIEIENITVGVHLQPLAAINPSLNEIHVYVHDIVGTTGASEGYGVLLSPANDNKVFVRAKNIKRHALYISAGASRNHCVVNVDTCHHHAVSLYSVAGQPVCADNTVYVKAVNLSNAEGQIGLSVALGITQHVERTRGYVSCYSSGATDHAVKLEGVGNISGPWPTNNVIEVNAKGTYLGNAVAYSADCDNTVFVEPVIEGKGVNGLIQFTDSGGNTYNPKRAGAVHGGSLDGGDSTNNGVIVSAARGAVDVSGGIKFERVAAPVMDYTGKRYGVNKQFQKTVQITDVAHDTSKSAVINLPESFANMAVFAQISSASAAGDALSAVVTAYTATSVTVAAYNRSGGPQAVMNVTVLVCGD